jgi:hypothetical protein
MNYIERVLPSLGETAVTLRSLGEVVDGVTARRHDLSAAAAVKGSARMATVLGRAVRDEAPGDPGELRWFYRDDRLVLSRRELRHLRRQLLSNGQKRNRARPKVERAVVDALWRQVSGERGRERGRDKFVAELTEDDRLTAFVEAWWPPLDAVQVWQWLRDPQRLRRWAEAVLSPDEVDALLESWADSDTPSIEDVPLVDELRYLLGDVPAEQDPTRRSGEVEGVSADMNRLLGDTPKQLMSFEESGQQRSTQRTEDDMYAHVLVDEAQDLSPMQWRMLGRRGRHASWTVVGDPAQSSWPTPDEAARARAEALHGKDEHTFRLSTNYRNSAEIFDFAAGVARLATADPDLPHAVRRTGIEPDHRTVDDLAASVHTAIKELLDAVAGSVAVVTPVARREQVAGWLLDADPRVRVLDALDTAGRAEVAHEHPTETGRWSRAGRHLCRRRARDRVGQPALGLTRGGHRVSEHHRPGDLRRLRHPRPGTAAAPDPDPTGLEPATGYGHRRGGVGQRRRQHRGAHRAERGDRQPACR